MSSIPNGGNNLYIAANATGYYYLHHNNSGWQGDTLVQAQPLNTSAAMACVPDTIDLNSDGTYTFWTAISNRGPNSTYFNIQSTSN